MKEIQIHTALRLFLFVTLGLLLLPSVSSQEPPISNEKPCLHYAYSNSEDYNFLILNQSKVFGQEIQFIHNCEYLQVNMEGQFYAISNNSMILTFDEGQHNLTVQTNEYIQNYSIEIYPDRLEWEGQFLLLNSIPETEFISIDASDSREVWASILSIVTVWVLCVYVYWKLIESYVNKNFIEEVVK